MALTLEEASKLSNDILLQGVVETIIKDSPILQRLPFIEIVGNSLIYNREKTLPGVKWYNVNEAWDEPVPPTFDRITAELHILGEHADLDNFIKATRSNVQDVESTVVELTAKAVKYEFEDTFLNGLGTAESKDFLGIDGMVVVHPAWAASTAYSLGDFVHATTFNGFRYECTTAGTSGASEPTWPLVEGDTVDDGTVTWTCRRSQLAIQDSAGDPTNGGTLTMAKLDELIDKIHGGNPDLLLMSRRSRRKLNALIRAAGSGMMETDRDKWGNFVQVWDGIPTGISDWVSDAQTVGSSTDCSTIYAMQFGEGALCGLTAPGHLTVEPVGQLESKDATRTRIKWYVSLALFSEIKLAKLIGVRD